MCNRLSIKCFLFLQVLLGSGVYAWTTLAGDSDANSISKKLIVLAFVMTPVVVLFVDVRRTREGVEPGLLDAMKIGGKTAVVLAFGALLSSLVVFAFPVLVEFVTNLEYSAIFWPGLFLVYGCVVGSFCYLLVGAANFIIYRKEHRLIEIERIEKLAGLVKRIETMD